MIQLHQQPLLSFFFFFNDTATTEIYTLSLHDALPILFFSAFSANSAVPSDPDLKTFQRFRLAVRSEEHTSELQSPCNLVCRLLLEKKKLLSFRLYVLTCLSTVINALSIR